MSVTDDVTGRFPIPLQWPRLELVSSMVTAIAVHHTAVEPYPAVGEAPIGLLFPAAEMTVEDELNHISVIHLYHKSKGFGGFGYHFIVFPSGRAYLVCPLDQWGAGVGGENDHIWHIAFAGDFTDRLPGAAQIAGARECVRLCNEVKKVAIYPHKAWGGTTCPGRVTEILNELKEDKMAGTLRLIQSRGGNAQYVTNWMEKWALPSGQVRDELIALGVLDGKALVVSDALFRAIQTVSRCPRPRLVWD